MGDRLRQAFGEVDGGGWLARDAVCGVRLFECIFLLSQQVNRLMDEADYGVGNQTWSGGFEPDCVIMESAPVGRSRRGSQSQGSNCL